MSHARTSAGFAAGQSRGDRVAVMEDELRDEREHQQRDRDAVERAGARRGLLGFVHAKRSS